MPTCSEEQTEVLICICHFTEIWLQGKKTFVERLPSSGKKITTTELEVYRVFLWLPLACYVTVADLRKYFF